MVCFEFWLPCPGRPFPWSERIPQIAGCCRQEASCRGKSPRLGGEALGSILGSAPTLRITLSMTMSMRPFLASVCPVRGLAPVSLNSQRIHPRSASVSCEAWSLSALVHLSFGLSTGSGPGPGRHQWSAGAPLPGGCIFCARDLPSSLGIPREAKK